MLRSKTKQKSRLLQRKRNLSYHLLIAALLVVSISIYKTVTVHADSSGVLASGTFTNGTTSSPNGTYANYTPDSNGTLTVSLAYSGVTPGYAGLTVSMGGGRLTESEYGNPVVVKFNVAANTNYLFGIFSSGGSGTYSVSYSFVAGDVSPTTSPFRSMPCFYTPWYDLPPQPDRDACASMPSSDSATSAPAPPTGMSAQTLGSSSIQLSWRASAGTVSGYRIYRGTNSDALSYLATTTNLTFPDSDLNPSLTYYYAVEAFTSQNVSAPARVSVATFSDTPINGNTASGGPGSGTGSSDKTANGNASGDTASQTPTAPSAYIGIYGPANGATLSGMVQVSGYTKASSDKTPITSVQVEIDQNGFVSTSGPSTTWYYQLNTRLYANTNHVITVKSIDSSGTTRSASVAVTFRNGSYAATAPTSQGTWISPEGMTIKVDSKGKNPHTGQPWTIADVYYMVKACASGTGDFATLAPYYSVNLNDNVVWMGKYNDYTVNSAQSTGNVWSNFNATTYLNGAVGAMLTQPYDVSCYEYDHAWTEYYYSIVDYPSLDSVSSAWGAPPNYLNERWVTTDGSTTLQQEFYPCLNFIDSWDGCISDDRRVLLGGPGANGGSAAADLVPGEPNTGYHEPVVPYMISGITPPQNQPGLAQWYLNHWMTGK